MAYDNGYVPNKGCSCLRCKIKGSMGAAVLVTVGAVFLLHNLSNHWGFVGPHYWPLLLIVIGLMLFAERSASIEGHIQPPGHPALPGTMPPPAAPAARGTDDPNPGSGADNHG